MPAAKKKQKASAASSSSATPAPTPSWEVMSFADRQKWVAQRIAQAKQSKLPIGGNKFTEDQCCRLCHAALDKTEYHKGPAKRNLGITIDWVAMAAKEFKGETCLTIFRDKSKKGENADEKGPREKPIGHSDLSNYFTRYWMPTRVLTPWTREEDDKLFELIMKLHASPSFKQIDWTGLSAAFDYRRSNEDCVNRSRAISKTVDKYRPMYDIVESKAGGKGKRKNAEGSAAAAEPKKRSKSTRSSGKSKRKRNEWDGGDSSDEEEEVDDESDADEEEEEFVDETGQTISRAEQKKQLELIQRKNWADNFRKETIEKAQAFAATKKRALYDTDDKDSGYISDTLSDTLSEFYPDDRLEVELQPFGISKAEDARQQAPFVLKIDPVTRRAVGIEYLKCTQKSTDEVPMLDDALELEISMDQDCEGLEAPVPAESRPQDLDDDFPISISSSQQDDADNDVELINVS